MTGFPAYSLSTYVDASLQERGLQGWSQRYRQLEPGTFQGRVETLALDGVTVSRETMNVGIHQLTAPPEGRTVYVSSLRPTAWRMNAEAMATATVAVLRDGEEQVAAFQGESDVLIVSVDDRLFEDPSRRPKAGPTVTVERSFDFCASWILSLLGAYASAEMGADLGLVLPGLIVDRLRHAVAGRAGSALGGASALALYRRAERAAGAAEGEALTVSDLAVRTGVGVEDLREAFVRTTGVGPGHWLRCRRLDGARRDLLDAARSGRTVTEIATAWGFWHFGRFSQTYAAHFGETPSRTLRGGRPG